MTLKIAIQKSGRLYDESIELLRKCGLKVEDSKGQLKAKISGYNAEILFLRNGDIPKYLEDGVVDLAIIGENVIVEESVDVVVLEKLGFSACRLSIATPKETVYSGVASLAGKRIATSYPKTLSSYLERNNIEAELHIISGSVEIAPNIGLADAICDIVSSGSTLVKNGLVEQDIVLTSEAVLAANTNAILEKSELVNDIIFRVKAVLKASENRYILFNIPNSNINNVSQILPVLKSPTVVPLLEDGWSSIHTVINRKDFWKIIGALKKEGAEGILVIPIENMIV